MKRKFKIATVCSEIYPFSKTGGLADVTCSLSKELKRLGHEVVVITPLYAQVIDIKNNDLKPIYENVDLEIDKENSIKINYWKGYLTNDLPVYFVENVKYFSKKKELYGSTHENRRFYLFDLAALKLLDLLKLEVDIIHCHDWHSGLIPELLIKLYKDNEVFKKTKTIFTIHNLIFQFGHNWWGIPVEQKDYGRKALPLFNDPEIETINFTKRAILNADLVNTVSEQYAQEILTPNFGQDLHRILENNKNKLFGIVNGIDQQEYNPATDLGLAKNYSIDSFYFKKQNKEALLKYFKLPIKLDIPLIAMASRVTEQKGFELLIKILDTLLKRNLQFVIMGDGDKKYLNILSKLQKKHPKKFSYLPFDQKWETSIYAGADILLLPSRYEPCGLNQLYALRYGCVPVVHNIGGLAETVEDFNPQKQKGNGFVFKYYHEYNLLIGIIRTVETYFYKEIWKKIITNGMKSSSSWEIPAKKYLALYKKALKR